MDAVLCLQFDKRRIISGSADRTIRYVFCMLPVLNCYDVPLAKFNG